MVVPMMRPDVFGALASHAGDALFEASYVPGFRESARTLRDDFEASWEVFFERLAEADHFSFDGSPRSWTTAWASPIHRTPSARARR